MKLVTFRDGRREAIGALLPDLRHVVDIARAHELVANRECASFQTMQALIEGGVEALETANLVFAKAPDSAVLALSSLALMAPLPRPIQMRDFMCFERHVRQALTQVVEMRASKSRDPKAERQRLMGIGADAPAAVWYEQPLYYKQNRFSVIGPGADVIWPSYARLMDFELELGVVIGKPGKNISRGDALDHVFGYLIFNDFSARDAQIKEVAGGLGPAKGKDFDTGNALGPWLVTKDEVPDPYSLRMTARVNGETWCDASSSEMHHKIEDMIAHVSADETLHAGEFLGSGTVGNGCGLEHGRFLKPGDEIELEIAGLGVLRNRLIQPERATV